MVNHLVRAANGRRLAVLVNEFGALPIDADLIEAQGESLIALADFVLLTKSGLVRADAMMAMMAMMALEDWLRPRAPRAKHLPVARGRVPAEVVLDTAPDRYHALVPATNTPEKSHGQGTFDSAPLTALGQDRPNTN